MGWFIFNLDTIDIVSICMLSLYRAWRTRTHFRIYKNFFIAIFEISSPCMLGQFFVLIIDVSIYDSFGNIIKNVCFKCLKHVFLLQKTVPSKSSSKSAFFIYIVFFIRCSFFKIYFPFLLIIFKNTIFSFIIIILMYHQQQNKWYPRRLLLAHFEANYKLYFSRTKFTCPIITWP